MSLSKYTIRIRFKPSHHIPSLKGTEITVLKNNAEDYISLTDIARHKDPEHADSIIQNWMRNRNTIELLGFWESICNLHFKPLEFERFRKQAGLNSFVMTPKKWIESTNAIQAFVDGNLNRNGLNLFEKLGYITDRQAPLYVRVTNTAVQTPSTNPLCNGCR